jgi:hypothetical protein
LIGNESHYWIKIFAAPVLPTGGVISTLKS